MTQRTSQVLATSVRANDILIVDGEAFRVVGSVEVTRMSRGFWLYPESVEPGRTIAQCYWWPNRDRVERVVR